MDSLTRLQQRLVLSFFYTFSPPLGKKTIRKKKIKIPKDP